MAKLAFLGLGLMGYPMARNLIKAGHDVALWSHTSAKVTQLIDETGSGSGSGKAFQTPADAAREADALFLCVGNSEMAEQVILGPNGIKEGARAGLAIADASTIAPSTSVRIARDLATVGVDYLDAPCTGSTPGATNGTLTFMIGGKQEIFERLKPFLEIMGKKMFYCGASGAGLHAKLTQNLVLGNILEAFCEGIVLSTKAGVEPKLMLEILSASAAKAGLIEYKAPFIFRRDFATAFSTKWMHKDLGLALDLGEELAVPLPQTATTKQMFQAAIAAGHADDDMCSIISTIEQWAGIQVHD